MNFTGSRKALAMQLKRLAREAREVANETDKLQRALKLDAIAARLEMLSESVDAGTLG